MPTKLIPLNRFGKAAPDDRALNPIDLFGLKHHAMKLAGLLRSMTESRHKMHLSRVTDCV